MKTTTSEVLHFLLQGDQGSGSLPSFGLNVGANQGDGGTSQESAQVQGAEAPPRQKAGRRRGSQVRIRAGYRASFH